MTKPLENIEELTPIWIVAFSGHRPSAEPGRTIDEINACRQKLHDEFVQLMDTASEKEGAIELICSAAEGADLLAIEVANALHIPVHLILPMPPESFVHDFTNPGELKPRDTWAKVEEHIAEANKSDSNGTIRIAIGDNARPSCYHDMNLQMLECADVLVAICKEDQLCEHIGQSPCTPPLHTELGGTAEIIQMASKDSFNIPTIIIDPSTTKKIDHPFEWQFDKPALRMFQQLSTDLKRVDAVSSSPKEQRTGEDDIWLVHQALDNVANNQGNKFRKCYERSIWLHFIATAIAATAATFAHDFPKDTRWSYTPIALTAIELLLVIAAIKFVYNARKASINSIWRRSRFGAELVVSQIYSAGFTDPLRPISMRHNETWRRFAMVVALNAHRQNSVRMAKIEKENRFFELKATYLKNRIQIQCDYFSNQQSAALSRLNKWNNTAWRASMLAACMILIALLIKINHHLHHHEPPLDWKIVAFVLFFPILLPLLAGLASSLIVAGDAARRASRFAQVEKRLRQLKKIIPIIHTHSAMQPVVIEAEDEILDEMIEWYSTAESMNHMH